MNMHVVAQSWNPSTVTWNNRSQHRADDPDYQIPINVTRDQDLSVDITGWIQEWTRGDMGSYGVQFAPDCVNLNWTLFTI